MITVKKGEVYITNYPEYIYDETDRPVKRIYFIDKVQNEEIHATVITYWRNSLPTMCRTIGPISDILAPTEGAVHQGTRADWLEALEPVSVLVGGYSKKVIEEGKK